MFNRLKVTRARKELDTANRLSLDEFKSRLVHCGILNKEALELELGALEKNCSVALLAKRLIESGCLTEFQSQTLQTTDGSGLTIGEYVIEDELGVGGMGQVYLGRHKRMKRQVAIKFLHAKLAKDADSVRRFEREVEAVAKLSHPNIVTAFDAGQIHDDHYLVMEYVAGLDLGRLVQINGPLAINEVIDCAIQAAEGLAYAHTRGVVHRDIKPSNLLVDHYGMLKVLDLGLARFESAPGVAELTKSMQLMGTVDFMSPEQAASSKTVDARADVYSLGITIYYLLTGDVPYKGETIVDRIVAHRTQLIPSLCAVRPEIPQSLDLLFQKMVAKKPDDRVATMSDVVGGLHALNIVRAKLKVEPPASTADEYQTVVGDRSSSSSEVKCVANSTLRVAQVETTTGKSHLPPIGESPDLREHAEPLATRPKGGRRTLLLCLSILSSSLALAVVLSILLDANPVFSITAFQPNSSVHSEELKVSRQPTNPEKESPVAKVEPSPPRTPKNVEPESGESRTKYEYENETRQLPVPPPIPIDPSARDTNRTSPMRVTYVLEVVNVVYRTEWRKTPLAGGGGTVMQQFQVYNLKDVEKRLVETERPPKSTPVMKEGAEFFEVRYDHLDKEITVFTRSAPRKVMIAP